MKPPILNLRPVAQILAIITLAELAILLLLPVVAPGVDGVAKVMLSITVLASASVPLILRRLYRAAMRTAGTGRHQVHFMAETVKATSARVTFAASAVVLVVGIGCSFLGAWRIHAGNVASDRTKFDVLAERLKTETERRFRTYAFGLRGARGTFIVSREVERGEFRAYVASRDLTSEFPGLLGFGFIERVPRPKLEAFIAAQRADEAPDYSVRTFGEAERAAELPELYLTKFIEPLDHNGVQVGYDFATDPARREALERAMLTGGTTITEKLSLVQDEQKRQGFLYFLPVYRNGTHPTTPGERRRDLVGWIDAPLVIEEALAGITNAAEGRVALKLYDGPVKAIQSLLYDEDTVAYAEHDTPAMTEVARLFQQRSVISVGGREWTLWLGSTPKFDAEVDRISPVLAGVGGAIISVLLAIVIWGLNSGRARALALARKMTEDLASAKERVESALRETEALHTTLSEHAIVSVADASGRIREINDNFCRISGYSRAELIGQDHKILNSGHHPRSFWAEFWRTIASGRAWHGQVCNRAKSGSPYWVDSIIAPFKNADGRIEKYVSIHSDITDRKRNEQTLQRLMQVAEEMGRVARVGGWEIEPATGRAAWTAEMYEIFEVPSTYVPELASTLAFFPGEGSRIVAEHVEQAATTGKGFDFTLPFRTAKGRSLWVRCLGKVERRADGTARLYGALQDVTESQIQNAELVNALDAAESASRAKGQFLANMSHEIRTPLTAILGYADVLREHWKSATAAGDELQAIETIRSAGQHLLSVINNVLDLSKIEAGQMVVSLVETPLLGILAEVESFVRPKAMGKGVTLSVALETPVPDRIISEPTYLRQIITNLAANAVKFTESGSVSIHLRSLVSDQGARLQVDVEDTGPGMTPRQTELIFNPFSQADSGMARKFGGTGLGLIISRRLAVLMGGNVMLERSEPGRGSVFRLELPLSPVVGAPLANTIESHDLRLPAPTPATAMQLTGRILLAEDGPENQRLISFYLRRAGAIVDIAENGEDALDMIEKAIALDAPYELLLTDMQMPDMDGYSLARTLRKRGSAQAIVALTAHAMAEDRDRCIAAGCNDYLTKPIDKVKLLAVCKAWMAKSGAALST